MKREETIDHLRALAIILMILTHSTAYYLKYKAAFFLWNISHFAVPVFIFCATYVFFKKSFDNVNFIGYLAKRLKRLLIPYYVFLLVYFFLLFFTRPKQLTSQFIFQSITITGGVDINWLVLLFVFFSFIFPALKYLINRHYPFFILYTLFSILSVFYFLVSKPLPDFRFYMWFPWSLIIVYYYYFNKYKNNNKFFLYSIIIGTVVFFLSFFTKKSLGSSMVFYNNKYPPNIYYLSYGLTMLSIIYLFLRQLSTRLNNFSRFISINSYSLFFIHYLVIYIFDYLSLQNKISWPVFFVYVLIFSLVIQMFITRGLIKWKKKPRENYEK